MLRRPAHQLLHSPHNPRARSMAIICANVLTRHVTCHILPCRLLC